MRRCVLEVLEGVLEFLGGVLEGLDGVLEAMLDQDSTKMTNNSKISEIFCKYKGKARILKRLAGS